METKQSRRVAGFPRQKLTLRPANCALVLPGALAGRKLSPLGILTAGAGSRRSQPRRYVERYSATPSDFSRISLRFCIHQPRSTEIGQIDRQAPKMAPFHV